MGLVLLYLAGIYTYIRLPVGGPEVPAVLAGVAGAGLLAANLRQIQTRHLLALSVPLGVAFLSVLLGMDPQRLVTSRVLSFIYLLYSVAIGYALYLELSGWSRREVAALFLGVMLFILVGCALEDYVPLFRSLSNAFRSAVFERGVYGADTRDQVLFGMIRPKLFTSEPSHVAKFFLLSSTVWLGLTNTRYRYLKFGAMAAAALILIRSPILILTVPLALIVKIWLDSDGVIRTMTRAPTRDRLFLAALMVAGVALLGVAIGTILQERFLRILAGRDGSFFLRIVAPMQIAVRAILHNPVFGVGLGGNDAIADEMRAVFRLSTVDVGRIEDNLASKVFNLFWMHWMFLGLVGGTAVLAALGWMTRVLGGRRLAFVFLSLLIFSQTMGGYVGARAWTFLFMLVIVSVVVTRDAASSASGSSLPVRAPA